MGRIEFTPETMLEDTVLLFAEVHGMTAADTSALFRSSGLDSHIREFYIEFGHKGLEDQVLSMRSYLGTHGFDCPPRIIPERLPPLFDYGADAAI